MSSRKVTMWFRWTIVLVVGAPVVLAVDAGDRVADGGGRMCRSTVALIGGVSTGRNLGYHPSRIACASVGDLRKRTSERGLSPGVAEVELLGLCPND
jgi:hypothetical protein